MKKIFHLFLLLLAFSSVTRAQYVEKINRFDGAIQEYKTQDQQNFPGLNQIVFTGSSSIRMWNTLEEDMGNLPVLNRGFGGSTIPEVQHYAEDVIYPYQPEILVLYAGDNDMALGATPSQVLKAYLDLISEVKSRLPDLEVYFIAIEPSVKRWNLWPQMAEANELIKTYSQGYDDLHFLDIATPALQSNGKVMDDIFKEDNLHLNAKGYDIWESVIRPEIQEAYKKSIALTLPRIFSDNMVLQRNKPIPVWGEGLPGQRIEVMMNGQNVSTVIDESGNWKVYLPEFESGGPYTLKITGYQNKEFENVMTGDVWLASGQSNMQWSLEWEVDNYEAEIAAADYPNLRIFTVPREVSNTPQSDITSGAWEPVTSDNIGPFSAVAYFFGRNLHQDLDIPIGLIHSSWGGTPAEAWTSAPMLKTLPDFTNKAEKEIEDPRYLPNEIPANNKRAALRDSIQENAQEGLAAGVNELKYDASGWDQIALPNDLSETTYSDYDGFIWYRKTIDLPAEFRKKELTLSPGRMVHSDLTYFNGELIGEGDNSQEYRTYKVPAKLVRKGENVIAIRILNRWGSGGLLGPADKIFLHPSDNAAEKINLNGDWRISTNIEPVFPRVEGYQNQVATLYNAMINPLVPYGLKGVIWYQGESNAGRAYQYRSLFPAMIEDWRVRFGQGYLPFLFVQLANYMQRKDQPVDDAWAELREAQMMTLKYPNTGMAVTIDIGNAMDIHPRNKQDVGKRLALAAYDVAYNLDSVPSGPLFQEMEVKGNEVVLEFDYSKGLTTKNGEAPSGFAIAGEDKAWHWAQARIEDEKVVVWSEEVDKPEAIRYGWQSNPEVNLYNQAGLPASPFRTDQWKGITEP